MDNMSNFLTFHLKKVQNQAQSASKTLDGSLQLLPNSKKRNDIYILKNKSIFPSFLVYNQRKDELILVNIKNKK